jgi:diguanylate cyclase (GGDEF)-like protein
MTDSAAALPRVLIVDDSRIVRATLVKHLKDSYAIREEADGEAGWEALLGDPQVKILISDLTMPRLDGYGLLQRVRGSAEARIRNLPVLLISGDEDEEARSRAKALGASDFIAKGIGTIELQTRLASLLKLAETQSELDASRDLLVKDPATGLLTRGAIERQVAQAMAYATRHQVPASVVMIGVDQAAPLRERYGEALADQLMRGAGQILGDKIRKEDSLGQFSADAFVILGPATPDSGAMIFAGRILDTFEQANINLQGKRLPLTVSIGFASLPVDAAADPAALLDLAYRRLQQAAAAGGNHIVGSSGRESGLHRPSLDVALSMLRAGRQAELQPHLAHLALQVLPLLQAVEGAFALGLPIDQIGNQLKELAQTEQHSGQEARPQGNASAGSINEGVS